MELTTSPADAGFPTPEALLESTKTGDLDSVYAALEKIYESCAQKGGLVPEDYVAVHMAALAVEIAAEDSTVPAPPTA